MTEQMEKILADDAFAEKIGTQIAQLLHLKPQYISETGETLSHARYDTLWGTKTGCGLVRTIINLIM
jgi:hypothetical protein